MELPGEGLKMMTIDISKKVILLCRQFKSTIVPIGGYFYCYCLFHQPCSQQHLDVGLTSRYLFLCSSKTDTQ